MIKYISKLVSKKVTPPESTSSKVQPSSLTPSTQALLSLTVSYNYNNDGILLNIFDDFINDNGYNNLINKTTYDVIQQYIIPLTKSNNISYANYIRMKYPDIINVYKANILICHSWNYMFLDVIDAIKLYITKNDINTNQLFIYFDAFCVNQNIPNNITIDWFTISYTKIIKNIKHTLVILSLNDDNMVLKRSFALFEIYCSIYNNCKISITMNNRDMIEYRALMCDSPVKALNKILLCIKFKDSSMNNVNDIEKVIAAIETMTSIDSIDNIIRNKMHDLIIDIMTQEIDLEIDGTKKISLLSTVATLHKSRGSFELAELMFLQNLDKMKLSLGHNHKDIYKFMNSLAVFYTKANRFEKAEALHLEILAYRKANGGDRNLETLTTKSNLACLYYSQGRYEEARLYYHSCLIGRKETLGESDKSTLETQNNLALTIVELVKQKRDFHLLNEAEELYLSTLARRKAVLGSNHHLVIETKNDLGSLYYLRNDLEKAEILFEEIYEEKMIEKMNPRRYLTALNNYANINFKKGNLEKALQLFISAYDNYTNKIGPDDVDTLTCSHNLASLLFSLEKFEESAALLESCLQKRKKKLGQTHNSTLATMNLYGLVLMALQQYDLAQPLLSFVLANKADHVVVGHHYGTKKVNKGNLITASPINSTSKNSSPVLLRGKNKSPYLKKQNRK